MKFVGTAVLRAAGYPLSRDKSASTIWDTRAARRALTR